MGACLSGVSKGKASPQSTNGKASPQAGKASPQSTKLAPRSIKAPQSNQVAPQSSDEVAPQSIRLARTPNAKRLARSRGASRFGPRIVDWSQSDPAKWTFPEVESGGSVSYTKPPKTEDISGPIEQGLQLLKEKPGEYEGVLYQTDMVNWPKDQHRYKLVKRTGSGFKVNDQPGGGFTYVEAKYKNLTPLEHVDIAKDQYTDTMLHRGAPVGSRSLLVGRGHGTGDWPGLRLIGDADPADVSQGAVGNCWLLSAISGFAEFDGAVQKLFAKTPQLEEMPRHETNFYTVTLYDLETWQPVDITVDERLCSRNGDGKTLLGAHPSVDGELWVCYLEKALAAHCGGWDKIEGGDCAHAWRLLTGCKEQYTITQVDGMDGMYGCFGTLNPNTGEHDLICNSPHDGEAAGTIWQVPWPAVGGGGDFSLTITASDLFERMCVWDDNNFLMGCGTKQGSDKNLTDGIVDGHSYTILQCASNVAGTDIDLIKVRNPWGKGEFTVGIWDDDGPGWERYPAVKDAIQHVEADDGVFWVSTEEFFAYFTSVCICAKNMEEFVEE